MIDLKLKNYSSSTKTFAISVITKKSFLLKIYVSMVGLSNCCIIFCSFKLFTIKPYKTLKKKHKMQ